MCPVYIVVCVHHEWEQLAGGVHRCRLPFLDVTVGLVHGRHGSLLIDAGTTLIEAAEIADDVRELTGGPVTHLVMTHHHFDHILGSAGFPDARTYAAPPVAVALTTGLDTTCEAALSYGAEPTEVARAGRCARPPGQLVWQADIDLGDRAVAVEHPGRGHTDHDLIVVVGPRLPADRPVVFCGDLVEESADPAVDGGSDLPAWPSALGRVLRAGGEQAIYVPGHGAVVDATYVRAQQDWLARQA
jgi:glyoxylase-like metal-dependent hydrolase (beta-lactamase superfamily II)